MPKTLTNTEPQRKPKIPDSLSIALKNGGPVVWASCLIMGLANILTFSSSRLRSCLQHGGVGDGVGL